MEATQYSRKLDTMGRIMIPKPLREELGLVIGQEYNFFLSDDRQYLCIQCPGISEQKLEEARRIVEQYGLTQR